jgi:SAM-dependent methyltransferase
MCNASTLAMTASAPADSGGAEFGGRLLTVINDAMLGMMISIGHRTALFEAMKRAGPATSQGLAEEAGLNERYVREWLAAMTTGRVVEFDPATRRYTLPAGHAALLGRDATEGNMAPMFQFIAVLGGVETRIVDCFRTGGGVPYDAYERFHEVMAEESDQTVVAALEEAILPLVPGLAGRLSQGIDVVDIGCGSGRALNRLAAAFPHSRFTGYDLCASAVAAARRQAAALGLANVRFETRDVTHLEGESYDLVLTFDAVHDQAHPAAVLANIRRLLRPGGIYLMQDIDAASALEDNLQHPLGTFAYTISTMHCMTVSLAQGGVGLGTAWGEQLAVSMLRDAGFGEVEVHRLPHDIVNLYYVCR